MSSGPFFTQIRGFAAEAGSKASEAPRGPLGNIFAFLPRWGSPGFWKKLGFYFVLILIVNGLITVGYYTMDHCYGVVQNKNGKWQLISNCHAHHHQFELILNFPGALDFVLDPAPLPPPASSTYIAITPVLNAPSENSSSQTANPYNPKADMAVVESATEKKTRRNLTQQVRHEYSGQQ